jgi:hypothetical protein
VGDKNENSYSMVTNKKQLEINSRNFSMDDLAIKYNCTIDHVKKLFLKYEIIIPRFIKWESGYIRKNYKNQTDMRIARTLGTAEQLVREYRLRMYCLREDEWDQERIKFYLKKQSLKGRCFYEKYLTAHNSVLWKGILAQYGSLQKAMEAAQLNYREHLISEQQIFAEFPDEQKIIEKILEIKNWDLPLKPYYIKNQTKTLYTAAIIYFASWKNALEQCGIDYRTVVDKSYRSKGRYFQKMVGEGLKLQGVNLGRPKPEQNPEKCDPDFYDVDSETWIDAKLHPWSYGIEHTINKYLKWTNKLWIIYLSGDAGSLEKMNACFPTVKFTCVNEWYDFLREHNAEGIINEFEGLKVENFRSEKYQAYRDRIKESKIKKIVRAKAKEYQNRTSGFIGAIKPTIFIDENGQAVINTDLMYEDIQLPWHFSRELFKESARQLVQEVFEYNQSFFVKEQHDAINYIDPNQVLDIIEKKYEQPRMTSRTLINMSYRINFAYHDRIYSAKYFLKTKDEVKQEVVKNEILDEIKIIMEKHTGKAPISDFGIANELKNRGYMIARRTVAKYRKDAGLSRSKERKKPSKKTGLSKEKNKMSPVEEMALSLLKAIKTDSPEYIPAMIEGLRYENKQIQKHCYLALKQMKEMAFSALFEILKKKNIKILQPIILLLAAIGPAAEESIEELKSHLNDKNQKISSLAAYAIQKIKPVA